ncbi:MAG: calcium/sodium antiporter [Ahrensia sp.]|nr:calcium/sodium antiporter [Ahrensia sp.]
MAVYFLLAGGLGLLFLGGDWLVRGAVGLADKLAIPAIIIGLTIVALGTSAPELVISIDAAWQGFGGLAVGNVVGSNIANVLLVLGIPAMIAPIVSPKNDVKTTSFFLVGLTAMFMVMMWNGPIDWMDGLALVTCLVAFLGLQYYKIQIAKRGTAEAFEEEVDNVPTRGSMIAALMIGGLIALPIGAQVTVDAAVEIAKKWSVSEDVIGLTVVAIGTSLPELATGIMATRNQSSSVAIGNVIGSNLFNIAAIMGITTLVATVEAGSHIVSFDMWVMAAVTGFLLIVVLAGVTIGRLLGLLLTTAYLCYVVATVAM